MERTLRQRLLVTLAATLVATAFGLLVGYWLGRAVTLRVAARVLGQSAMQAIGDSAALSRDAHAVLDAINASRSEFCSEEDLASIRGLVFRSHFLKEAGRIRDGRVACSTTLGRVPPRGAELPKPDVIGADGVKVYRDLALFRLDQTSVTSLQAGDSYIVLNPFFSSLRGHAAAHLRTTVIDSPQNHAAHPMDAITQLTWAERIKESDFRIGDILYSTRCSFGYNTCMTASLSVSEALSSDHLRFYGSILFGGATGAWMGLLLSLSYRRSRSIAHQLRRAILKDKLRVVYQPIVNLASGEIVGAEALARWTDEEGFVVGPDVFVKIAEERSFVGEITRLVVRHVLRDFAVTLLAHPDFRISINIAAADLGDPRFLPMLEQSLGRAGVLAASVVIEITESSTALHQVALEAIRHLRILGHGVHIDDFGTGYSSLSYLHDLSVDAIKIDQSFTRSIGTEAVTVSILPQILAMAEKLHLQVVVEGIETSQQAAYFSGGSKSILGQGWFFGHPVPPEKILRLLAASGLHRPQGGSSSEKAVDYVTEGI
jgi:sensor c-di-GMP phosphodiesterase-like protein